jgi:hypothetical protein
MKQRNGFVMLLLCLHLSMQAQEAMFIHSGQQCVALDIQNIGEVTVNQDSLVADVSNYYYSTPADSVTFGDFVSGDSNALQQEAKPMRIGWWGGLSDSQQACYYHPNADDVPDIQLFVDDNRCSMAVCIIPEAYANDTLSTSIAGQAPRKVGSKWRYVKGTLTGRHKFHLACYDNQPFMGHEVVEQDGPTESGTSYLRVTMQDMFEEKPIADVRRALNYWYRPASTRQLPAAPLFGKSYGYHYEQSLPGDSADVTLFITVNDNDSTMVYGDSLTITFTSTDVAYRQFQQIGLEDEEGIRCFRAGCSIIIIETFQATLDEVRQWLVRFDLDLRKPLFIREE